MKSVLISKLVKSLLEDKMLGEDVDVVEVESDPDKLPAYSVDDQIDFLIQNAEKAAVAAYDEGDSAGDQHESLFFEADEQDEDDESSEESGEDLIDAGKKEIDMNTFASEIARLTQNYENILDIKSVIVNKAMDFLAKNYSEEEKEMFLDILQANFDVSIAKASDKYDDGDDEPIEYAVGALGAGSGGGSVGGTGGAI